MSNIQFEEGFNQVNKQFYNTPDSSKGITAWLIKKGIAKDAKKAQAIMLIFAIICFALTFYIMPGNSKPSNSTNGSNEPIHLQKLLQEKASQNQ